jgi:hypothetical protein
LKNYSPSKDINASDLFLLIKNQPKDADRLTCQYLNQIFGDKNIVAAKVSLNAKIALNSISGTCISENGERLFFKFHTEENESISLAENEIYQSGILSNLGWNIVKPIAYSKIPGRQCVLYPLMHQSTAYDFLSKLDAEYLTSREYSDGKNLLFLDCLRQSLTDQQKLILDSIKINDKDLSRAPIHQLFSHRLNPINSEIVRFDRFYQDSSKIFSKQWIVNNFEIPWTIQQLVDDSKRLLNAQSSNGMASVIAHGDDHFGNQFVMENNLLLFDPAFAGRMPALLAPVKPTAHNVMAHPFWLYDPSVLNENLKFDVDQSNDKICLTHNLNQQIVSPIRVEIQKLYIQIIWQPLLSKLKTLNALPFEWRRYVTCAMFCSPFLAKNLTDANQYPGDRPIFNLGFLLAACAKFDAMLSELGL